jgi:hypothetical protein
MRFLLGLIIGIAITIGGAYLHDINAPASGPSAAPSVAAGPIVNWPTLQAIVHDQADFVRGTWHKIFG